MKWKDDEVIQESDEHANLEADSSTSDSSEEEEPQPARERRIRRAPAYLSDYVSEENISDEEEVLNLALLTSTCDPSTFEEAYKQEKWRKAMDQEIQSIERNNTQRNSRKKLKLHS